MEIRVFKILISEIFFEHQLQEDVNRWLKENVNRYNIHSVSSTMNKDYFIITVLFSKSIT